MKNISDLTQALPLFKCLGSDIRIAILELLSENGPMAMKDIADELDITAGSLSPHIKMLSDNALINIQFETGKLTFRISGAIDNRGVTLSMQTYRFTFGYFDVDNPDIPSDVKKVKRAFLEAFATVQALYDSTAAEEYSATEAMRQELHLTMEAFTDFKSHSPAEWNAAGDSLIAAAEPLKARKALLDDYYSVRRRAYELIEQYADNTLVNETRNYTYLVKAYNSSSNQPTQKNLSSERTVTNAINQLQSYIDRMETTIATGVDMVTSDSKSRKDNQYDLLGRKVDRRYKGVVVRNGRKTVRVR